MWTSDGCENHPDLWRDRMPRPVAQENKFSRGQALIWGGYPMTGAARLAARAAARMGAGVVTVLVPPIAVPIYAATLTSILVHPAADLAALRAVLADHPQTALLIGPGAGAACRAPVLAMLAARRPTILDADALSVFRAKPRKLLAALHEDCILTPHEGEFSRLFDLTGDKLSRCRAAARHSGAVVVLKGADTVIAHPDGRAVINANAPPWLATAGAGDVLAGMILGLVAQGMAPFDSACAAVWLHGAAAQVFGLGLMAEDLPDLLPPLLHQLLSAGLGVWMPPAKKSGQGCKAFGL